MIRATKDAARTLKSSKCSRCLANPRILGSNFCGSPENQCTKAHQCARNANKNAVFISRRVSDRQILPIRPSLKILYPVSTNRLRLDIVYELFCYGRYGPIRTTKDAAIDKSSVYICRRVSVRSIPPIRPSLRVQSPVSTNRLRYDIGKFYGPVYDSYECEKKIVGVIIIGRKSSARNNGTKKTEKCLIFYTSIWLWLIWVDQNK